MMMDPIADMITRIRNAQMVRKATVLVPYSKLKDTIAQILLSEGFIEAFEPKDEIPSKVLLIKLKYYGKKPAIQSIKRESKPGYRMYRKAEEMPKVLNDYGIAIVSTSKGLMTNKQARQEGVGGEILCSVY